MKQTHSGRASASDTKTPTETQASIGKTLPNMSGREQLRQSIKTGPLPKTVLEAYRRIRTKSES